MTVQTDDGGWIPQDTLALRLILVRRVLGLSQRAAAAQCDLTFGEWQSMEAGSAARGVAEKVTKISAATGVDRDWLMWGGPLRSAAGSDVKLPPDSEPAPDDDGGDRDGSARRLAVPRWAWTRRAG
jgi:transcriptional regulator with XRE-family HTH domain